MNPTPQQIIEIVSRETGIPVESILGRSRVPRVIESVRICIALIRQLIPHLSMAEIGLAVGRRHPSTVHFLLGRHNEDERVSYKNTYSKLRHIARGKESV